MVCQGSYSVSVPAIGGSCTSECAGCSWTISCSVSDGADGCEYSYTVTRSGCTNNPDNTWTESGTLACGSRLVKEFHCDTAGNCVGRKLTILCSQDQ